MDKPTVAQDTGAATRRRKFVRRGFTFIEMLAIIALMAIFTATVTISLVGAARSARVEDVTEQFVSFDRSTREIARRFGRTPELRFDLSRGTAQRLEPDREPVALLLGGDLRVTRVIVRAERAGSGEITVPFSDRGQSPSYAVLLSGRAGQRWVAFAGLTGQPMVLTDEREVQDILSPAAADNGAVAVRADAR